MGLQTQTPCVLKRAHSVYVRNNCTANVFVAIGPSSTIVAFLPATVELVEEEEYPLGPTRREPVKSPVRAGANVEQLRAGNTVSCAVGSLP